MFLIRSLQVRRFMGAQGCWILILAVLQVSVVFATNPQEASALMALRDTWQTSIPFSWVGTDPCGNNWLGIICENDHITSITLPSLGLQGTLTGDIGSFSKLQTLDLSYNKNLEGSLPSNIGNLLNLVNLLLIDCSFSGQIPSELGSLQKLQYLSLNSNYFTGNIPATIGLLSELYWFDVEDNHLTGSIPVSDGTSPGLDMLTDCKHFHFGTNRLGGSIPSKLFSSNMSLIHVLFDNNNISGSIPSTLWLVKTLQIIRFDWNSLDGPVPPGINYLNQLQVLLLSNNKLDGPLPNLAGMDALNYVDLSNNSFAASNVPGWFSALPSLTTLYLEYLGIGGEIPTSLFSSSPLQTVRLRNNSFNGILDIGSDYSRQLELVDLQFNQIDSVIYGGGYSQQLMLLGNPFCEHQSGEFPKYCGVKQQNIPYSTPQENCEPISCPSGQNLSPDCKCAYPYSGNLSFRAIFFSDLTNSTYYQGMESSLIRSFQTRQLPVGTVSLQNVSMDATNYLTVFVEVFPSGGDCFDQSDVSSIGSMFSNRTAKMPKYLGPYTFYASDYTSCQVTQHGSSSSNHIPLIVGATVGAAALVVLLISLVGFAMCMKNRRKKDVDQSRSSVSSRNPSKTSGMSPQLKGARWFSFEELKNCTNNFSESNDIGFGGYGKVYKGTLVNGQEVAIKRARHDSMQGEFEFKNEIELLSRVHHKHLVDLVGFSTDHGEQMLVYEYVKNGSLRRCLSGDSGIKLDWNARLRIALGAAKGLTYMHELASPPIIHRDFKSSNILIDHHLNAKVADFGLSKPVGNDENGYVTTHVKGTMGYMDPEYYMTQQLTEKSDVYSFGVVLLELISARRPIEEGRYIVKQVKTKMDKAKSFYGLHQFVDPLLVYNGEILPGFEKTVDLAMSCLQESGEDRPTMSEVMKEIEAIMQASGLNPNAESASSSATYAGSRNGGSTSNPNDLKEFDYSGGKLNSKIEPK